MKRKIFYTNIFNFTDNYSDCGSYMTAFLNTFALSILLAISIWLCQNWETRSKLKSSI